MTITLENLQSLLKELDLDIEKQKETNQLYAIIDVKQKKYPLFARLMGEGELVQLIAFIPCEMKEEANKDLACLLHLFNKELDIPGFGMDEMARVVYFRTMIPTVNGKLDKTVTKNFLKTIHLAIENFALPIQVIASGQTDYNEMLKKAKDAAASENK